MWHRNLSLAVGDVTSLEESIGEDWEVVVNSGALQASSFSLAVIFECLYLSGDMLQALGHIEVLKNQDTDCFGYLIHTDDVQVETTPLSRAFRT